MARWTSAGFRSWRTSSEKPSRANPPTRWFSTTASAPRRRVAGPRAPPPSARSSRMRPLVPVDGEVVGGRPRPVRGVADPRRSPAARRVALGRLDLDDVGAEVAEEHRAERAGEDRRAVDDAMPARGPRFVSVTFTRRMVARLVVAPGARQSGGRSRLRASSSPSRTHSTRSRFTTIVPRASSTMSGPDAEQDHGVGQRDHRVAARAGRRGDPRPSELWMRPATT